MIRKLAIITGNKRDVFRNSSAIRRENPKHLTIVTELENVDIFATMSSKPKIYVMNAETFLIIQDQVIHDKCGEVFHQTNTELSTALVSSIMRFKTNISWPSSLENESLYFEKISYPIDAVHSAIRGGDKKLVGLNIGGDEDPTMRPSILLLNSVITSLVRSGFKIVIFGSSRNRIREKMIEREHHSYSFTKSEIIFASHFYDDVPLLAQAIDLCDVFVSFDSFLMDLSVSIGKQTVGIFANTDFESIGSYENLIKIPTSKEKEIYKKCYPCDNERCPLCDSPEFDGNCFDDLDPSYLKNIIINILKG